MSGRIKKKEKLSMKNKAIIFALFVTVLFLAILAFLVVRGNTHIAIFEAEPNNSFDEAQVFEIKPVASAIYGEIDGSQDYDFYQFYAEKDKGLLFSLAIPDKERVELRHPKFVIIGQGLGRANEDLPFSIGIDNGMINFKADRVRREKKMSLTSGSWLRVGTLYFEPRETGWYHLVVLDKFGESGRYVIEQTGREPINPFALFNLVVSRVRIVFGFY